MYPLALPKGTLYRLTTSRDRLYSRGSDQEVRRREVPTDFAESLQIFVVNKFYGFDLLFRQTSLLCIIIQHQYSFSSPGGLVLNRLCSQ